MTNYICTQRVLCVRVFIRITFSVFSKILILVSCFVQPLKSDRTDRAPVKVWCPTVKSEGQAPNRVPVIVKSLVLYFVNSCYCSLVWSSYKHHSVVYIVFYLLSLLSSQTVVLPHNFRVVVQHRKTCYIDVLMCFKTLN